MNAMPATQTSQGRRDLREQLLATNDEFVRGIPKIELHVHLEGTLTPDLRWKLARRNNMKLQMGKSPKDLRSEEEMAQAYRDVISSAQLPLFKDHAPSEVPATFFEAYYSGCEVLKTSQDFFDVAYGYFERAAAMNVRYCEMFFDPQSHTARGVSWADMMEGLRSAQLKAATTLNVRSNWIMCFLRDSSLDSAMVHYREAMAYKDIIIGFGLDSNEHKCPPSLFEDVFSLARRDGFRITAHCDVGQADTLENIRQVTSTLGGSGADRVDHGLNAADKEELISMLLQKGTGLTLCPWAYVRRWTYEEVAARMRVVVEAGVKVCISSDSPAYMDDCWVLHNLLVTKQMCGLSNKKVSVIMRDSIEMSWASRDLKASLLLELDAFVEAPAI